MQPTSSVVWEASSKLSIWTLGVHQIGGMGSSGLASASPNYRQWGASRKGIGDDDHTHLQSAINFDDAMRSAAATAFMVLMRMRAEEEVFSDVDRCIYFAVFLTRMAYSVRFRTFQKL